MAERPATSPQAPAAEISPVPAPAAAVPAPSQLGVSPSPPSGIAEYQALSRRAERLGFTTVAQLIEAMERLDETPDSNPAQSPQDPTMTAPSQPPAAPSPATTSAISPAATPAPASTIPEPAPTAVSPASAPIPASAQAIPPEEDPQERRLPDHVRARLKKAREDMRTKTAMAEQQAAQFQQQATTYQQQIAVMQAEESMKIDLVRSGVKELDFVWFDMKKHIAALSADKTPDGLAKLKAFDVAAWAAEQRKTRPFLFGEQPVPANTGAPAGTPPAPAQPGAPAVNGAAAGAGQFDARSADAQSYRKRMAELGIEVGGYMAPPRRN